MGENLSAKAVSEKMGNLEFAAALFELVETVEDWGQDTTCYVTLITAVDVDTKAVDVTITFTDHKAES